MRNKLMLFFKSGRILQYFTILLTMAVLIVLSGKIFAQDRIQITGTVIEGTTGDPLPGVSILIKGTTVGTITDIEGKYSIDAVSADVLVFSFIGYLTEEMPVGSQTVIDVTLVQDIIGLEEVIVTGYGVQRKSDVTGSIASVSSEDLVAIPIAGVDQALQGLAAGDLPHVGYAERRRCRDRNH